MADFYSKEIKCGKDDPGGELTSIRIFGRSKNGKMNIQSELTWEPAADVIEADTEVLIIVDIAGMDNRDINVMTDGKILRISGDRRIAGISKGKQFHQMEIMVGRFERAIELPVVVDPSKINASYRKGMLEIRVRKLNHSVKTKKIKIR